jgi:hypothetical protein
MFLCAVTVHCAKASEVAYKICQGTNSEITNIPLEYTCLNRATSTGNVRNPGSKHAPVVCNFLQPNTQPIRRRKWSVVRKITRGIGTVWKHNSTWYFFLRSITLSVILNSAVFVLLRDTQWRLQCSRRWVRRFNFKLRQRGSGIFALAFSLLGMNSLLKIQYWSYNAIRLNWLSNHPVEYRL